MEKQHITTSREDEETAKGRQKVGHRERERVSTKIMIEFKVIW
jgi:hypothetical protein